MSGGWICLHRQLIESRAFQNEGLLKVWIWCLLKANHERAWVTIKSGKTIQEVEVLPGQFVFGRNSASKELKIPGSTIRNRMAKLKKMQNLDIKADSNYSIITIINWESYQDPQKKEDSKEDRQRTGKGQAKDTNNNENNENNKKPYTSDFENFWSAYPKKVGKKAAFNAFKKNKKNMPQADILKSIIEKQKNSNQWTKNNGQYIPNPEKWIKQGRWDDEIVNDCMIGNRQMPETNKYCD